MYIYKITNLINNKIYIGLTSNSIEERWRQHKATANRGDLKHLYSSMRKYGIDNFTIEVIDETSDFQELGELEKKYIKEYNARDPNIGYNIAIGGHDAYLEKNGRAKITNKDVIHIREIYTMCELSCKECWLLYKEKISFSAFQKIWEGTTWKSIMPEIYTKERIKEHSEKGIKLPGCQNGNAIYTDDEVLEIRKFYVNHTLKETFNTYGSKNKSIEGFRGIIARSYKYLPIYSKTKKRWELNEEPIDIEKYKPVSTISESGE